MIPYSGFTDDDQTFISSVDGTSIVLSTGTPALNDIVLIWDAGSGAYTPGTLNTANVGSSSDWQSVAIDLVLEDFNVDGIIDVLLKNIDSLIPAIPNLVDQIVFANPSEGAVPLGITSTDEEFQSFFSDVYNWMLNPEYFNEYAPLVDEQIPTTTGAGWYYYAVNPWAGNAAFAACYAVHDDCGGYVGILASVLSAEVCAAAALDGISCSLPGYHVLGYTETMTLINVQVPDFSVFNQDALSFSDAFNNTLLEGGLYAQTSDAIDIGNILKTIFGSVDILGGVLENGGIIIDIEVGQSADERARDRSEAVRWTFNWFNDDDEESVSSSCGGQSAQSHQNRIWGSNPIAQQIHFDRNDNQSSPQFLTEANLPIRVDESVEGFDNRGQTGIHNIGTSGNKDYRGYWSNANPYKGWQLI